MYNLYLCCGIGTQFTSTRRVLEPGIGSGVSLEKTKECCKTQVRCFVCYRQTPHVSAANPSQPMNTGSVPLMWNVKAEQPRSRTRVSSPKETESATGKRPQTRRGGGDEGGLRPQPNSPEFRLSTLRGNPDWAMAMSFRAM